MDQSNGEESRNEDDLSIDDSGGFSAHILVWSNSVRLAEITKVLGIEPDEFHDIGDVNPYRDGGIYKWSKWKMQLDVEHPISPGTEGLSEAIEAMSDEVADRMRSLADRSCNVELRLRQTFEGDDELDDPGIYLTAPAIRWLARAGGLLDVSQLLWVAGEDGASP